MIHRVQTHQRSDHYVQLHVSRERCRSFDSNRTKPNNARPRSQHHIKLIPSRINPINFHIACFPPRSRKLGLNCAMKRNVIQRLLPRSFFLLISSFFFVLGERGVRQFISGWWMRASQGTNESGSDFCTDPIRR